MIDPRVVTEFLSHRHLAVIGASGDRRNFGNTIYRELASRGYNVVAVNPNAATVEGDPCYPDMASVPGELDGAIVMVARDKAADVVRACTARGVPRVWLFKGVGGTGSMSDEAVEVCQKAGVEFVAGACPLMFLEPVGWYHKAHRALRHLNGSLAKGP